LPAAVGSAENVGTAFRRADAALSVAEKLEEIKSPQAEAGKKMIAQVSAVLNAKYPALALSADMEQARLRFTERLAKLLPTAAPVDKDHKTEMVVAHEAALLAFNKGDFAAAVQILDQALAQHKSDKRARPEEAQSLHLLAARALLGLQRHREAKVHLNALLDDKRTTGIGQLMLGAVAAAEGRQQDALGQFLRAERELGSNPLVEISLAQTYLALSQWEAALPHLTALHELLKTDAPELQAWIKQHEFTEARVHLQEARALLALKRQDDARPHLLALTGTPLEPQAAVLEGDLLFSLGDLDGADRVLSSALKKFPTDAQLVGNRAALLKKQEKTDELTKFLAASAAAAPDDLRMQLIVARELVRAGKPAEAIAALDALEKKHPDMVPILLLKADAFLQSGKMAEAQAMAEKIQGLSNSGALGGMVGAVIALRSNDPKQAALALKASAEEAPDNLQVRHLEAELAAVSGDYPAAIAALGDSVRVTSLRGRAGPLLCFCVAKLAEKSGPPAAEAAVMPLVEKTPDEPFVLIAHSDVLAMQGKFHDSLKQLDLLESLEKKSALPPYLKAVVLARAGDPVAALADANRSLALEPKYVPALTLAAQLNLAAKAYPAAITNLDAALGVTPAAWNLALLKSEVLWAAGKQTEAIDVARALIEKLPEQVEARRHLVALQSRETKQPRYEQALADCRAAREKFADDVPLTVQEILLLQLVGKADESQSLADKFVGQPADAGKAFMLAQGFGQLQKFVPAQTWAETAMKTASPELKPQLHRFLGMLAMSQQGAKGDRKLLEQAREHFTAVLTAQPQDFVSGNNLAWMLAVDFDQPAEAVKVAERARAGVAVDRLPITFVDTLAVVYRRAGEFQKASVLLDEALQAHPDENVLKFHLGMTLGQIDRLHEAKQLLQEAIVGKLSPEKDKEAQQEIVRIDAAEAAAEAAAQAAAEAAAEAKAAKIAAERAAKAAAKAKAAAAKRDTNADKTPAADSK
jgi:predicted Zn-dependent protease